MECSNRGKEFQMNKTPVFLIFLATLHFLYPLGAGTVLWLNKNFDVINSFSSLGGISLLDLIPIILIVMVAIYLKFIRKRGILRP